jgi:hypothetical protein
MKKILSYFFCLTLLLAVIIACNKARGPVETHELILPPLTGFELGIRDNVYLTQGPSQHIVIEGQRNVVEELNKIANGGIWKICFADKKPRQYRDMKIYVTLPEIRYIGSTGPGIISSKTKLHSDSMLIKMEGSGYIDLNVDARIIHCEMNGKGDIFLKGTCEQQYINVSGTGSISSFDMQTRLCKATISGSGNANTSVSEKLSVHISGSGSLQYLGNPEVEAIVEGTGTVMKAR